MRVCWCGVAGGAGIIQAGNSPSAAYGPALPLGVWILFYALSTASLLLALRLSTSCHKCNLKQRLTTATERRDIRGRHPGILRVQDAVSTGGPLLALLGFIVLPLVWSVPEALVTAELATAFPEDSGYVAWVTAAFGPFWGFQEGWWSWLSGVTDNSVYPVLLLSYVDAVLPGAPAPRRPWTLKPYLCVPRAAAVVRGRRAAGCAGALYLKKPSIEENPKKSMPGGLVVLAERRDRQLRVPRAAAVVRRRRAAGCAGAPHLRKPSINKNPKSPCQEGWWSWLSGVTDNSVYPVLLLSYVDAVLPGALAPRRTLGIGRRAGGRG